VGLQARGPWPWLGGHGQSSTVLSRRLVSAVRKLQGREDYSQLATTRSTEAEDIVGIRCQPTLSEDIEGLVRTVTVYTNTVDLVYVLFKYSGKKSFLV
jgi:hypothetical protein